jgi:ferritin-like metal-binding protein YciE
MGLLSKIDNLEDLFINELSDQYHSEKQLAKALVKMAEHATNPQLKAAFTAHQKETENHVARIEKVFELCNTKAKSNSCEATEGLIKEASEAMSDVKQGPLLDVALILVAQKVEHYEIAGYGGLCELAKQLGFAEAKKILGQTLDEEKASDQKLTTIAEASVNQEGVTFSKAA